MSVWDQVFSLKLLNFSTIAPNEAYCLGLLVGLLFGLLISPLLDKLIGKKE